MRFSSRTLFVQILVLLVTISPAFGQRKIDSIAEAYASQASRSLARGEIANATTLYLKAIEQEQKDANDELYIAKLHNDLGECYRRLAHDRKERQILGLTPDECLKQAEELLHQSLVIKELRSRDRTDFIYIALTLENLAQVHLERHNLAECEALLRKAILIRESKEGKDTPNCASAYLYLGDALKRGGTFGEAEQNYQKALAIYRRSSSATDPVLGVCHHRLALLFYESNKVARAGEQYDLAVSFYKKNLPSTARNLQKLTEEDLPHLPVESYGQAYMELLENTNKPTPPPPSVYKSLLKNLLAACRRNGANADAKLVEEKLAKFGGHS